LLYKHLSESRPRPAPMSPQYRPHPAPALPPLIMDCTLTYPGGDTETELHTDERVRQIQQLHEGMAKNGASKEQLQDSFKKFGVKTPCAFSRLVYFHVIFMYLLDLMHVLSNLVQRLHKSICGGNWSANCRNFAREFKVNRGWLVAPPQPRNATRVRTAAQRLAGK